MIFQFLLDVNSQRCGESCRDSGDSGPANHRPVRPAALTLAVVVVVLHHVLQLAWWRGGAGGGDSSRIWRQLITLQYSPEISHIFIIINTIILTHL